MSKYFNNAIIGNSKILGCLDGKGELIRLYYPNIDYFQNIDFYKLGIVDNNHVLWFSDAFFSKQEYNGNIVYTELHIGEYKVIQKDYILPNKNILVRKISVNKNVRLIVYSKLNSNPNRLVSGMFVKNSLVQYCQDMYMTTFSNEKVSHYQINNVQNNIYDGNLFAEDYIGMSDNSAIVYDNLSEITLYIAMDSTLKDCLNTIDYLSIADEEVLFRETASYWTAQLDKYLAKTDSKVLSNLSEGERKIIERTVFMFELLSSPETGAMLASPDVDENFTRSGRYGYCWPRDALFINKALLLLGMKDKVEKFYNVWAEKAQLEDGLFEQRYFSNGELAPSWGIQIDETASMLIGINDFGKCRKLENLIIKSTNSLLDFLDEKSISKPCFDLWEERREQHLYSTLSIYAGLKAAKTMLLKIGRNKALVKEIDKTLEKILIEVRNNFVENGVFKRSVNNSQTDISSLAMVVPFDAFDVNNPIVKNTVMEIEKNLKLENGGYLRYKDDSYIGGNAWIISSLWLALYYIKANNFERARELFDWVTNHSDEMGFLPEQIERNGNNTAWIVQLSWSHAMYVIVKSKLEG